MRRCGTVRRGPDQPPPRLRRSAVALARAEKPALPISLLCILAFGTFSAQRAPADLEALPFAPRQYVAYRAPSRIIVDGKLDEPAWAAAAWSEPFVDIEGESEAMPERELVKQ